MPFGGNPHMADITNPCGSCSPLSDKYRERRGAKDGKNGQQCYLLIGDVCILKC